MFKKSILVFFVLLTLFSFSTISLGNEVFMVPTADVLPTGLMDIGYRFQRGMHSLQVQAGVYPGISVGVRQDFGHSLSVNAKLAFIEETASRPGVALGGQLGLAEKNIYALASKQLGRPGLRGHLGLQLGSSSGALAAINMVLNPVRVTSKSGYDLPTTSAFFEYDGHGLNTGLTAQFSPELKANLVWAINSGVGVGVNYRLAF